MRTMGKMKSLTRNEKIQLVVEVMMAEMKRMVAEGRPLEQIQAFNQGQLDLIAIMAKEEE
jgi:hypothetical protein